ncbi:MAG: hypothetical protein ACRC8A_13690 [Microcoleaceae cyanobacterium]
MDALIQQLTSLNRKIDALYELTMQINGKFTSGLPVNPAPQAVSSVFSESVSVPQTLTHSFRYSDPEFEHKDVLSDDNYLETGMIYRQEPGLTSDIQIQRLTAQLTAAYNRIAALEEQLLARRTHF